MNADLQVEGHKGDVLYFWVVADPSGSLELAESDYASLGFAVADAMLRSMNWVD